MINLTRDIAWQGNVLVLISTASTAVSHAAGICAWCADPGFFAQDLMELFEENCMCMTHLL